MSRESSRDRAPADTEAELREQLDADALVTRRDAAVGLVEAAADGLDTRTVEALAERIDSDEDSDVRQFAVEALGVAAAGVGAIGAALEDADPWVRAEAVVAHSRASPDDESTLRTALDDDSGWVRRNAVIALGKTGAVTDEELLDRLKHDPHPPVREYAARYLRERADDTAEAVRVLAAVLAREPNAFVRAKAAESLGELGTDRAEDALERQGLHDRSEDVRRTARRALAAARGQDPETIDLPDSSPPGGGPDSPAGGGTPARSGGQPIGPDAGTHGGDRR